MITARVVGTDGVDLVAQAITGPITGPATGPVPEEGR
jgi:hypothetical protein